MEFPEVLRRRRMELGLSRADLAGGAGVHERQLARYETGEAQPTLGVAVAIANALEISLSHLAGYPSQDLDLSGQWWAAWQTSHDSQPAIHYHEASADQRNRTLHVRAVTRAATIDAGGYLWQGELDLHDNEVLMGWYAATEDAIRSKGTMYFHLSRQGLAMTGRWVGLNYDGTIRTGWAAMTRDEGESRSLIHELVRKGDQHMSDDDICEVRITAPTLDWLAAHTRQLVEDRLAACGQHDPAIRSIYRWRGAIEDDTEARVSLHTRRQLVPEIIRRTIEAHPDELPGIIVVPIIDANPAYLQWVRAETPTPGPPPPPQWAAAFSAQMSTSHHDYP